MLINHKRFKKRIEEHELEKYIESNKIIHQFPHSNISLFNILKKEKFHFIETKCLCKSSNDILLSEVDRHGNEFYIVICKSCGLIRALKYFTENEAKNFYNQIYRASKYDKENSNPKNYYQKQSIRSKKIIELIKKNSEIKIKNLDILDYGGGPGGLLNEFIKENNCYNYELQEEYVRFSKENGINIFNFDQEKKFDIIIISHVVEHWINFEKEIKKLISLQKFNHTLNIIEFPGIDSLEDGRRGYDVLGEFHFPHNYYFQKDVFENIMNKYGFEKIYIDKLTSSIFVYNQCKAEHRNFFEKTKKILINSEKKRKIQIIKNIIRYILKLFKFRN